MEWLTKPGQNHYAAIPLNALLNRNNSARVLGGEIMSYIRCTLPHQPPLKEKKKSNLYVIVTILTAKCLTVLLLIVPHQVKL